MISSSNRYELSRLSLKDRLRRDIDVRIDLYWGVVEVLSRTVVRAPNLLVHLARVDTFVGLLALVLVDRISFLRFERRVVRLVHRGDLTRQFRVVTDTHLRLDSTPSFSIKIVLRAHHRPMNSSLLQD